MLLNEVIKYSFMFDDFYLDIEMVMLFRDFRKVYMVLINKIFFLWKFYFSSLKLDGD